MIGWNEGWGCVKGKVALKLTVMDGVEAQDVLNLKSLNQGYSLDCIYTGESDYD